MNDVYRSLADSFDRLAEGYRALAKENADDLPNESHLDEETPRLTMEEVREVLKLKDSDKVRPLLMKYDAGKLSGVKPEDYAALVAEAEAL